MPDAADLTDQLADEERAKQRRYVLANTRARWRFVALGAVLLAILRVARVAPVSWPFILGFAGVFAAISYAMLRMARGGEFRDDLRDPLRGGSDGTPVVRRVSDRAAPGGAVSRPD